MIAILAFDYFKTFLYPDFRIFWTKKNIAFFTEFFIEFSKFDIFAHSKFFYFFNLLFSWRPRKHFRNFFLYFFFGWICFHYNIHAGRRIWTFEGTKHNRFWVCPLWPLGYPRKYKNLKYSSYKKLYKYSFLRYIKTAIVIQQHLFPFRTQKLRGLRHWF